MRKLLGILFAVSAFAGQSIQTSTTWATASLPGRAITLPSRVEFYFHDWNLAPTNNSTVVASTAMGLTAILQTSGPGLILFNQLEGAPVTNSGLCTISLAGLPTQGIYIRYMHNPGTSTDTCEAWNTNGIRVFYNLWTYGSSVGSPSAGFQVGGGFGENRSIAFARVYSDLVAVNSRMPVTADPSITRLIELKFDGTLADASGNRLTASMSSGSPTYVSTPNQNVFSVVKTANAPAWSNWTSVRAGYPAQLDGTASGSQSDASAAVTCFWQSLAGPSAPTWSSRTSCTPTLTGLVFGGYNFQLVATDAGGASGTSTLQIGAVATDDNGVIVNTDPNADLIYGPMIAFGKNPWQYQDERALKATTLRSAAYDAQGLNPPSWAVALPGTVSYPIAGITTTLCGAVADAVVLSVTICTAEKIDLTSFPTHILVGVLGGAEEMLITGTTGTSGTQTLTVAYDGRGFRRGSYQHANAQAWGNGSTVTQGKVTGSGTSLLTTFNPAGPGINGPIAYNTGTLTATAGSAIVTGAEANWTLATLCPGKGGLCALTARINGTHGAGIPFLFNAVVNSIDSPTQLTLNRPFPADADTAAGLSYNILVGSDQSQNFMVLHYDRPDLTAYPYDGATYFYLSACESDTACYISSWFDPTAYSPVTATCLGFTGMECGKHVAYMSGLGYVGDNYGANFYDEGLAHYALYLRSGWQPALDAFRKLEGTDIGADPTKVGWMFYPELAVGGLPRRASVTGAVAAAVLDGKASNWPALRGFATRGISAITDPLGCDNDVREGTAYPLSWLTFGALFDPNATQQATWTTQLGNAYTFDVGCAGSGSPLKTNSWQSGFNWNNVMTPALTATNGSAVLTSATPITAQVCPMIGQGTDAVVTNGSDVVTSPGNHFVDSVAGSPPLSNHGKMMFFGDALNPILAFDFIYDNPGQMHLSGKYPGTTATNVRWQLDYASTYYYVNPDAGMAIGSSSNDPQLSKNWACVLSNGGLTMTLDRPWDGPSSSALHAWHAALGGIYAAGRGTQPFILGIKTLQMSYGAKMPGELGTNYNTLATGAATWIKNYGVDPVSGGLYYARVYQQCEPVYAESSQPDNFQFGFRNPGCSYNSSNGTSQAKSISRALIGEAQNAARVSFQADSSDGNRTFWDTLYNNQWGAAGLTDPVFYTDGITTSNVDDTSLAGGKWTGFFFGIGMSHQWPAARLGGAAAAVNRNLYIAYHIETIPRATRFQIVLTAPSGKNSIVACLTSPCVVPADARQGAHLMTLQYLSASSKILSQSSEAIPVTVQ